MTTNLEHGDGNTTGNVGGTEQLDLLRHKFYAIHGLYDDVQTGKDGVGLGQEVAVAHKLGLGNGSEVPELILVFGVSLQEATVRKFRCIRMTCVMKESNSNSLLEQNLRSDIAVFPGGIPGFAEDAPFGRA